MKKTFSWITALVTGIMLLVASCSNSSQVTFVDPDKNNFTADGLAAITVDPNFNSPFSRTIWPEDLTESAKTGFLYVLTGNKGASLSTNELGVNGTANSGEKKGLVFTYEQIKDKKAIANLEPVAWSLKLTVYKTEPSDIAKDFDITDTKNDKKVAFSAEMQNQDLATGSQTITFNLKADNPVDATATGNVNVQVKFYDEGEKIKGAKFELFKADTANDFVKGDVAKGAKWNETFETANPAAGKFAKIAKIGANGHSSISLIGDVPAGRHILRVTFYSLRDSQPETDEGSYTPVGFYEEPILVVGGNTSRAIIDIPEGVMNKAPASPSNLAASVAFEPVAGKQTLADGRNVQVLAKGNGDVAPVDICENYELTFTWKDESYNESMFMLKLTNEKNDWVEIKPAATAAPDNITVTAGGTGGTTKGLDSKIKGVTDKGSLDAGSESITISVPTGTIFTKAELSALNDITENGVAPNSAAALDSIKLGMVTVSYGLEFNNTPKIAKVTDASGEIANGQTGNEYLVMAYDVNATANLIDNTVYPFVEYTENSGTPYVLNGWSYANNGGYDNTNYGNGTNVDKLDLTKNTVVYPIWGVKTTVAVTFPDYSVYRDLALTEPDTNTVEYDSKAEQNKPFKITAYNPQGDTPKTSDFCFVVKDPTGTKDLFDSNKAAQQSNPAGIQQGDDVSNPAKDNNVLTWDPAKFSGGTYPVIISYNYDEDGKGDLAPVPISGTIYVKIIK